LFIGSGRQRRAFTCAAVAVAVLAYLPFVGAGAALFSGAAAYFGRWQGNAVSFALLDGLLAGITDHHNAIARGISGTAFLLWIAALARAPDVRRGSPASLVRSAFLALAAFIVLSACVYPWYLTWTLPFLCLRPSPAWLLLTGTIFGFYAHDFAGHHQEIWWVTALEYGLPLLAALSIAVRHRLRPRSSPETAEEVASPGV
jgi:hypothetical protein